LKLFQKTFKHSKHELSTIGMHDLTRHKSSSLRAQVTACSGNVVDMSKAPQRHLGLSRGEAVLQRVIGNVWVMS
jgi:hypothetical protein